MLMKKIQLQLIFWVRRPPTSGPTASASAETPAQIPIAVPRCRRGKVAVMMESVAGFSSAAPTPWRVRAAMSEASVAERIGSSALVAGALVVRWYLGHRFLLEMRESLGALRSAP